METMNTYRLVLEPDDNGTILVTSPDLPIVTYGEDESAALRHAIDAAHALLGSIMDAKEDVPLAPPALDDTGPRLRLPLQTRLKLELYQALRRDGLTRADLQRRLGWQRESVDRLFRLDHQSKLGQLDEAFQALGRTVEVAVAA